jgi:hypothetical protein
MPNIYLTGGDYYKDGVPIVGLSGSNYIYVAASGSATDNAAELQAAYDLAKTMSPGSSNRITIIAGPGYYDFGSAAFIMDTQYIDLVSLDGNRSVIFNSANSAGTISITANDVFVKGVDVETKNFTIADSLNLLRVENCVGRAFSFGGDDTGGSNPITVSGTFIDCQGGDYSFGAYGTASGIFTNCNSSGVDSFGGGGGGTASGIFSNCIGGNYSFGGGSGGTASGTFINCQGGDNSFAANGLASGIFNGCIGTNSTFGGYGTASGTFVNCRGGDESFGGYGFPEGVFTNCQGGNNSFGGLGTASGTFTNCTGGSLAFGGFILASGTFINCQGGQSSFGSGDSVSEYYGTASGTFTNCIGGQNSFGGDGGTASGTFTDCVGGLVSFAGNGSAEGNFTNCIGGLGAFGGGGSGTLTGKLYYCRLTSGTFQTVSGGGRTIYCIDGNNNTNNQ